MNPSSLSDHSQDRLLDIWIEATPLSEALYSELTSLPVDVQALAEKDQKISELKLQSQEIEESDQTNLARFGRLSLSMSITAIESGYENDRRRAVKELVRLRLQRSVVMAVGRNSVTGQLELLDRHAWMTAGFGFSDDDVRADGAEFTHVRITRAQLLDSVAAKAPNPSTEVSAARGEESKEPLRQEAIADCVAKSPHHWREPPEARRRAYASYLQEVHGMDVKQVRGFGEKSWEASEAEYKKLSRSNPPQSS